MKDSWLATPPQKVVKASRLENQKDVGGENNQVHEAVEDVGPASSEGQRAYQQSQKQEHHRRIRQAEHEVGPKINAYGGNGGHGQADRGDRRSEREVDAPLQLVGPGCAKGGYPFGKKDKEGDQKAGKGFGRSGISKPGLDGGRESLGEQDDRDQRSQEKDGRLPRDGLAFLRRPRL